MITKRIAIALTLVLALVSLGIAIGSSRIWSSEQIFDSYRSGKIDRQSNSELSNYTDLSLESDRDLDLIQFLTPDVGWVGDHYGHLFATKDAGKTWQNKELRFPSQSGRLFFPAIYFSSRDSGWAIAQKYNPPGEDICRRNAWLLHTTDGGSNWSVLLEKKCAEVGFLSFANESEGWLFGHQFFNGRNVTANLLVMHTSDGGKTWTDVSEAPNSLMSDLAGRVLESPGGIVAIANRSATAITSNGYLLDSNDGGRQWRRAGGLALHQLVPEIKSAPNASIAVTGRIGGTHGTAGMLALRDASGKWKGTWFRDFFLGDAVFLSEREIVACGYLLPESQEELLERKHEGAIIFSRDGGSNWTILYKGSDGSTFNALTQTPDGKIWAVGPKGLLIKLGPPRR
jgi:photosystem II stability/assembly factor-like uncharacterized protein